MSDVSDDAVSDPQTPATPSAPRAAPTPAAPVAPGSSKNKVNSLLKGLKVLEVFTAQDDGLTMAAIARRAGLDNATAFRLLNTLEEGGYVRRLTDSRLFRLTPKVLDLGFSAIAHSDLRTQARPILSGLVGDINEAASVGVLVGSEILYIERVHAGMGRLGIEVRVGSRMPAYSTAIGHAYLAWQPEAVQIAVLEAFPRHKRTNTTLVALDDLLARLKDVRERGYAVSNQENVFGGYILAAPVLGPDGLSQASLSAVTPVSRMSLEAFVAQTAPRVVAAAQELSKFFQTMADHPASSMR